MSLAQFLHCAPKGRAALTSAISLESNPRRMGRRTRFADDAEPRVDSLAEADVVEREELPVKKPYLVDKRKKCRQCG